MEKQKPKNESSDNPFSFRNFLTTPVSTATNIEPSPQNNVTLGNHTSNINYSPFSSRRRENGERGANPYSFARFLQSPSTSARIDNGLLSQGELPDFVQDHFTSSNLDTNHRNGLPDFTFHTHHEPQSQDIDNQTSLLSPASSIDDLSISRLNDVDNTRISTSTNLPDFLSDTGINIVSKDNDIPQNTDLTLSTVSLNAHANGIHSDTGDDDHKTERISELENELSQKNHRIHQLEQQLLEQKRKEEEDTEIMETMIRQVDANLEKAVTGILKRNDRQSHLDEDLHVLLTVSGVEEDARRKMKSCKDYITSLFDEAVSKTIGEDEEKQKQLMEYAILRGTYRDKSFQNHKRHYQNIEANGAKRIKRQILNSNFISANVLPNTPPSLILYNQLDPSYSTMIFSHFNIL